MGYSHRYYSDAERLKAVKGYMNAGMTVSKYAEKIGVNPRTLRDWIRAFRSFNGGFINITKATNDPSKLVAIQKLFENESKYHKERLNPLQIKEKRNNEDIPIINEIHDLVFNANPKKNSYLEGAINYVKKIWNDLLTFLEDGHIELTNNVAERAVKPFVIQRKVFQISSSYDGAKYTTILFSIIRSAIINCLNVEAYLLWVLNNINTLSIEVAFSFCR